MSRLPLAPAPASRASSTEAFALAVMLYQQGDHAGARRQLKVVLRKQPRHFDGLHLMGLLEAQRGHYEDGEKLVRQALLINPQSPDAQSNRGNMLRELGDHETAVACYDLALRLKPDYPNALNNRGIALAALGRLDEAVQSYDAALALEPKFPAAHYNRGVARARLKQFAEAIADYDRALALDPSLIAARIDRANALVEMGRLDDAVGAYNLILAADPRAVPARYNLGLAQMRHDRFDEAIANFDVVLQIEPGHAVAHDSRGNALMALGRHAEALESYDSAVRAAPGVATLLNNRGIALQKQSRLKDALASFDAALRGDPKLASAHSNRAHTLLALGRLADARAAFDHAVAADPQSLDLRANRAAAAMTARQYERALDDLEFVYAADPRYPYILGNLVYCRMQCCDWRNLGDLQRRLNDRIRAGERVSMPFIATTVSGDQDLHLRAAQIWARDMSFAAVPNAGSIRRHNEKIRIAYLSADFRDHPVAAQSVELFERHDRDRFEVTAISLGPSDGSTIRKRLEGAFDVFHDVSMKSDQDIADLIHAAEVDIAVDLTGYTDNCRPGILARRPAPVQVNYLGYPATMGVAHMDYIIADRRVVPEGAEQYFSEKIVRLPDTYFVSDSTRTLGVTPTRTEAGLPESGFVFCCFNNRFKITPDIFEVWMRLLRKIDSSVLWLAGGNAISADNLRKAAQSHGIAPDRLIFARRVPSLADHLARHQQADLFLDTLPYNAHSTTTDALWAGLPVLTCAGTAFAGRVAASLLTAAGLPELVVSTLADYESLALRLAQDPSLLADIHSKLSQKRDSCPLFNTGSLCWNLESAYTQMVEHHRSGGRPESFDLSLSF